MSLIQIEKIYKNKEEIIEFEKTLYESQNLKFIENCLWDFAMILDKQNDKEMCAWNKLYGFLDDLSEQEWKQFEKAARRQPLFEKKETP